MDTKKNIDKDPKKGEPLGTPEYQGHGDASPEGAGDEGGLGFIGDQRGSTEDDLPSLDVDTSEGTPIRPSSDSDSDPKKKSK